MELTTTATDWAAMRFDARKGNLGDRWYSFQRRTLADAWDIGRGLRCIKDEMQHGEFRPYLAEIGMNREAARRFMALAEAYEMTQLVSFASVDDAIKALPPARPEPQAAPEPQPEPAAEQPPEPSEPEAEAAMNVAAAEHEAETAERDRDARDERLSVRLENADGEAVDALADQLDRADARHRDDVLSVNEARRMANAVMRTKIDIRDAWLAVPRDADAPTLQAMVDDWLATFFNSARPK